MKNNDDAVHISLDMVLDRYGEDNTFYCVAEGTTQELGELLAQLVDTDPTWYKIFQHAALKGSYNLNFIGDAELEELQEGIEEMDVMKQVDLTELLEDG